MNPQTSTSFQGSVPLISLYMAFASFTWIITVLLYILMIIAFWKIFKKAGQKGWKSLIPVYNSIILLKIAGLPQWWILLFFIPIVSIIVSIILAINLAKVFNRSKLFGIIVLWLFSGIGYLILGFGKSVYKGAMPNSPTPPLSSTQTPVEPPPPLPGQTPLSS